MLPCLFCYLAIQICFSVVVLLASFGIKYKSLAEQMANFSKLGHNDGDGTKETQLDGW